MDGESASPTRLLLRRSPSLQLSCVLFSDVDYFCILRKENLQWCRLVYASALMTVSYSAYYVMLHMQYFVTVLLCSCNERVFLYLEWIPMFLTGLSNHEHRDNLRYLRPLLFSRVTCFVSLRSCVVSYQQHMQSDRHGCGFQYGGKGSQPWTHASPCSSGLIFRF